MKEYLKSIGTYFLKLLIVLVLFTFTRVAFLLCNLEYIGSATLDNFIGGLRFDIASVAIVNFPFTILYCFPVFLKFTQKKITVILFAMLNFIALAANLIDCAYFSFTLKRTTSDLFTTKGIGQDILHLLPSFIKDFWYLFLLSGMLSWLLIKLFKKYPSAGFEMGSVKHILLRSLLLLVFLAGTVVAWRGGLQLRPINIVTAGSYGNSKQIALVLNTPFTIIRTATQKKLKEVNYFTKAEVDQIFPLTREFKGVGINGKNVVILVLESFGEEYVGSLSGHPSYTPFLDSLIPSCSRATHAYANGRKSIEAMPAITASIPTLGEIPFVSSPFAGNEINALPAILGKHGYSSSFFHGGQNGTMGFDVYASLAGYQQYYGLNEYPNPQDYDGKWGIPDEPYLLYFAKTLSTFKPPFLTTVFTLSSHHPFTVPEHYRNTLPQGTLPIHQSVAYTDQSLKKFFEYAKTQSWYSNTVFVFTADHTSLSEDPTYSTTGIYSIPILFFEPEKPGHKYDWTMQQLDITPTVLDMLDYKGTLQFLGKSLLDSTSQSWNLNYLEGTYQYIEANYLLRFNGEESTGLYNLGLALPAGKNYHREDPVRVAAMEKKAKAIIQQYNNRQISNSLTRP